MKRYQQVSKFNGCGTLTNSIKKNMWYGKVTSTTKQYKIGYKITYYCAKKRFILSRTPHLDKKKVKILTESDVPVDIKMGIE